jgi:quinolinate synthase
MRDGKPEITWQPEFDRAKEVLTRSLLNPPATAHVQPMGD